MIKRRRRKRPAGPAGRRGKMPDSTICPTCGRPLDEHNRHLRFGLPDPVLKVPPAERAGRTWGNDVLMQVQEVGAFVRILVPIRLSGGYTVTFGAWLGVHPDELRGAYETWWAPAYAELRLSGVLANGLPPWEARTYAKPLDAAVLDPDQVPYAVASPDEAMQQVLSMEWPHDVVLAALARYGHRFRG